MNNLKAKALSSILIFAALPTQAGTVTQAVAVNINTVTALSFTGDFTFNIEDLVGGDTILTTEDITLNDDLGE